MNERMKRKIDQAEKNKDRWEQIVLNESWGEVGKTKAQAVALENYYEGILDGLWESTTA